VKLVFLIPYIFLFFLSCKGDDNSSTVNSNESVSEETQEKLDDESAIEEGENTENLLLQLNGSQLVDANQIPVYLQGVAFNNYVWDNNPLPPNDHHNERDYERVSAMGMNTIRFYMNYHIFEDDNQPYTYKQSGWDWLDQNIAWAKKHDIYLVLNMQVPQGGYQSAGDGVALWENNENQNRLVALWRAIADRYKNEVHIAGFGPMNEPVPTQSISQWSVLAQRLINNIREVNKNHLIFIEQANYVLGSFTKDENFNFPEVEANNLIYEFHGYAPYYYSHQLLDFAKLGDGGKYPNENIIEVDKSTWHTAIYNNPSVPHGSTDWTFFEGLPYTVNDTEIALGVPTLLASEIEGKVYYDDISVKEFDQNGAFIRDVHSINLNTLSGWRFWSQNDSGNHGLSNNEGHNDSSSIFIKGTTSVSNLSFFDGRFEITQGHSYQVSGWMKGDNVSNTANGKIRLEFYKTEGPIFKRNKAYLENFLTNVSDWAKAKNAALFMGEFGVGTPCFQNGKGGLVWVSDMVSLLKEKNIHFTYHTYHATKDASFGLYLGNGLPNTNNVNQLLIDWFTANLK